MTDFELSGLIQDGRKAVLDRVQAWSVTWAAAGVTRERAPAVEMHEAPLGYEWACKAVSIADFNIFVHVHV